MCCPIAIASVGDSSIFRPPSSHPTDVRSLSFPTRDPPSQREDADELDETDSLNDTVCLNMSPRPNATDSIEVTESEAVLAVRQCVCAVRQRMLAVLRAVLIVTEPEVVLAVRQYVITLQCVPFGCGGAVKRPKDIVVPTFR